MLLILTAFEFVHARNFYGTTPETSGGYRSKAADDDEEDVIFESVMDPPSWNRRYRFENQVASRQKRASKKTSAEIDLAEIEELRARVTQLEEQNRRQAIEMTRLLNQHIAEYISSMVDAFYSQLV